MKALRTSCVFLLASLFALIGIEAQALTLRECVETALAHHPAIRSAREGINAGAGRVAQATAPYLPQVKASTGYSESRSQGGAFTGFIGGGSEETITKQYATTLSVDQLLYDFGKTGNARDAARYGERAAEQELDKVVQETILNVKQAYFALLQAKKLAVVAHQTRAQTESHLNQAEAFFHAGSRPRFDVTRAEVDVNNAKLGVINAENAVRVNTINLYTAMGVDPRQELEIEDILTQQGVQPSLEQAQAEALRSRPDMQKAESDVAAARERVQAEESNYLPTLSAGGQYTWAHGRTSMGSFGAADVKDNWSAGITLSLPLFEGGLTRGRVGEARANQRAFEAQRDLLRQSILLEVYRAEAELESAQARIAVMESSLKSARESLALAEGRYEAGVGQSLEVTDAQVAAAKAETDHVQALYDYQLAAAKLAKAMGKGHE